MPGRDGTGPLGEGQMTGGGFGFCRSGARVYSRNFSRTGMGLGMRNGEGGLRGGRRLMRNNYLPYAYDSVSPEEEKEILRNDLAYLEEQMQEIKGRLQNMKQDGEK